MRVGNEHYLNLLSYRFELSSCDRFNDSFMSFCISIISFPLDGGPRPGRAGGHRGAVLEGNQSESLHHTKAADCWPQTFRHPIVTTPVK